MKIANPSSLPCQPLADLSGKARDHALCKVLYLTRTHCHNVKCFPYSTTLAFSLWDTRGWRGAYCFPARANAPQKCNLLSDTPALPLYDLLLSLFGFIKTFNYLFSICEPLAHTLKVAHIKPFLYIFTGWQGTAASPSNSGLRFWIFFLLLLSLLARKMILCHACCTFYIRAFKFFLTGMHSAL